MEILDLKKFDDDGFLVLESVFSTDECDQLMREIENHSISGAMPLKTKDAHSQLITNESILSICSKLMRGTGFRFHHLHSACSARIPGRARRASQAQVPACSQATLAGFLSHRK